VPPIDVVVAPPDLPELGSQALGIEVEAD